MAFRSTGRLDLLYVTVAEKTQIMTQETLVCWAQCRQHMLISSRGVGHQPQVSHTFNWSKVTQLLPSHTTCLFKSALKGPPDAQYSWAFLIKQQKSGTEHKQTPYQDWATPRAHVTASPLGEVLTNHLLEKSCRCCFKSIRKARTHQNRHLHMQRGWHQQLRTWHLSQPLRFGLTEKVS